MTESYLDITKSVMISAPAGSGKTEKLARRYIELLKSGSDVERILAITFTEKAAAEMKERILNILKKEDPELFERVREKMPRMRISTIHSFCLKLLKRFSLDLDVDPSLEVMDGFNANILWSEAVYECLLEDNASGEGLFYEVIKDSGIKGWNKLYSILGELHGKRPTIEFGIKSSANGHFVELGVQGSEQSHFERILSIYSKCLKRYKRRKMERHCLDYNDLELMAYEAISKNPEWQNVLYSFDEHTDHILVDEFQDTSMLQWKIIDKLTEEWRSGLGAKRETGVNPTIFLVGDDKQSIYSFRGANVSIFKNAKKKLTEWLGEEYHFIEIKENYRSLPAIVNFVNTLFERLMPKGLYDDYKVEYTPFDATRAGEGNVELVLLDSIGNTKENRKAEAAVIARKIKELAGTYVIYDNKERGISQGGQSPSCVQKRCGYGDMAILLRSRTHLSIFEDALRRENIPFIVVKGIGFYNSPEVGILRDLLFFLIDPHDDYSLFNILRSPLFSIGYDTLLKIAKDAVIDDMPAGYLFESLKKYAAQHPNTPSLQHSITLLAKWLERAKDTPYAVLLEDILAEADAWHYFHEKQRYVNVKKFIRLVEEFEYNGLTGLEIREKLIKASKKSEEAKANVNTEGMDAVRIMTIHASKGLQFPMVFLPCLDEDSKARGSSNVVMDEDENGIVIAYEEDFNIRKKTPLFQRHKERLQDEEKRLFYVAVTRAMDYLCMSGVWPDPGTKSSSEKLAGKLAYIADSFNLIDIDSTSGLPFKINRVGADGSGVKSLELRVKSQESHISKLITENSELFDEPVFIEPLDYKPSPEWLDVTEEINEVRKKHGDDWVVLGRAFHRIFEGISKRHITMDNLKNKTTDMLKNEVMSDADADNMKNVILLDFKKLDESGHLKDIILPQEDSYAELPFVLDMGSRIYKGRIDRLIIKEGQGDKIAYIYDYKTYPISEEEIPELMERYFFQMDIYKKAVERLFSVKARSYIFFTHEPRLVEMV
ncbi:MAG: UvrD-helicase domain-containing protein [Nitrospirota bacterium]